MGGGIAPTPPPLGRAGGKLVVRAIAAAKPPPPPEPSLLAARLLDCEIAAMSPEPAKLGDAPSSLPLPSSPPPPPPAIGGGKLPGGPRDGGAAGGGAARPASGAGGARRGFASPPGGLIALITPGPTDARRPAPGSLGGGKRPTDVVRICVVAAGAAGAAGVVQHPWSHDIDSSANQ